MSGWLNKQVEDVRFWYNVDADIDEFSVDLYRATPTGLRELFVTLTCPNGMTRTWGKDWKSFMNGPIDIDEIKPMLFKWYDMCCKHNTVAYH